MADTQWKEITAEEFAANPKKDPEKEALKARKVTLPRAPKGPLMMSPPFSQT